MCLLIYMVNFAVCEITFFFRMIIKSKSCNIVKPKDSLTAFESEYNETEKYVKTGELICFYLFDIFSVCSYCLILHYFVVHHKLFDKKPKLSCVLFLQSVCLLTPKAVFHAAADLQLLQRQGCV